MEDPQPATRGAETTGQPPSRPPLPGPGPRPAAASGPPPATDVPPPADWATFVESCKRLADRIASIRQIRWIRKSSASMRWVLLVVAVGLGSALLIALTISMLVSLVPKSS